MKRLKSMVMKRIVLAVWLVTAAAALASASFGQENAPRMEQIVQSFVANKTFMGSVLVVRDKTVLFEKGYGSADLEWDIPNSPSTKFRLGSITKQFTAASIMLLEERGKLKIEDPVKKYMPDAPAAWDKVTIYNLLTHTSGIPSFTELPDYDSLEPFTTTSEKLVARFRDKPLEFEPGEKFKYDNSGYALLGYLIEKISGQTYAQFVQDNIFTPLQMKDSGYDSNSAIIMRRASGYTNGKQGIENAGFINMTVPFAAGSLYSTVEDLARWEQGLFGGKVLSAASLQKMTTPFKSNYAFGLAVSTANGHKVIEHGGGIEGFNTHLSYYPDDKLTVVVLANLNGDAPGNIAHKLASIAHGETVTLPSERREVAVAPAILANYVGTYALSPDFSLVITLEGGQLMSQATGQGKFPLFAESDTKFFLKTIDAQVEFVKNDKGEVTGLILHQGGRDTNATKK
ncbi:MAG TPA: serine hydrolase [Candidatus Acidoferrales bacterium]|nr:serine hydrolase [Candidatus Acidoferrales bacterium]